MKRIQTDGAQSHEQFVVTKHADLAPILIFPATYEFFLSHGRLGHEALGLYVHLIWTAERQRNNRVWADDVYLRNGLRIGVQKLKSLKSFLAEHGLIVYHQERDETGRYVSREDGGKRYIKVLYKSGGTESAPAVPGGTETVPDGPVVQFTGGTVNRSTGSEKQIPIQQEKLPIRKETVPAVAGKLAPLKDELGRRIEDTFTAVTPWEAWASIPAERGALKTIVRNVRQLHPIVIAHYETAEDLAGAVLTKYHELTTGTDNFWAQQPFTPRGLLSMWSRVLKALQAAHESDASWDQAWAEARRDA